MEIFNTDSMEEQEEESFCFIDHETIHDLELVSNTTDSFNRRDTLYGFMNRTCTTSGARLLKEEILKPYIHLKTLELRSDCVNKLVERPDNHALILNELSFFGQGVDLDKIVQNIVSLATHRSETLRMAEKRIDIIISLYRLIVRVPSLVSTLQNIDHSIINIFRQSLNIAEYDKIHNAMIETLTIDDKEFRSNKRGRMLHIRQGIYELFDVARATYVDAIDNLENYVRELNNVDHLPWRLSYAESKGFILQLSVNRIDKNLKLPPKYLRVVQTRSSITCTTSEMMKGNVRANISYENSMKLANEILVSLLNAILGHIGAINTLVEVVGRLDLISSLAKLAIEEASLVQPIYSNHETVVEESRHPVLENLMKNDGLNTVPNDVCLSVKGSNFSLITGPNMGGKTVYLKQLALIQIMAQIGSFVPAKRAVIRPLNRIIARTGSSDDGRSNCSSFMSEMKGVATALAVSPHEPCLYIIDEVGRGTSINDGLAYSLAIAEELAMRENSFTLFSTHFTTLSQLPNFAPKVKIFHFKIEEDSNRKLNILKHQLMPGFVQNCHYGLELAEACNLPREITEEARRILIQKTT